jgi:aquaporin rerated protein, other eukaryote
MQEPAMGFLPSKHKGHLTAFFAELAGTFLFLLFSFAIAQVANTPVPTGDDDTLPTALPSVDKIFFIATGFGCSVAVNVWLFYRVSGGMFNPAVSQLHSPCLAATAKICRSLSLFGLWELFLHSDAVLWFWRR